MRNCIHNVNKGQRNFCEKQTKSSLSFLTVENANLKTKKSVITHESLCFKDYIINRYQYIVPYISAFIIFFIIEFITFSISNNEIDEVALYSVFVSTDTLNILLSLLLSEAIQGIICKSGGIVIWISLILGLVFYIAFEITSAFSKNNVFLNVRIYVNIFYSLITIFFVARGAANNFKQ